MHAITADFTCGIPPAPTAKWRRLGYGGQPNRPPATTHRTFLLGKLEAPPGFEPGVEVLRTLKAPKRKT